MRYAEAARCFVDATQANTKDPRAAKHLKELLSER
jgi:hypothetical protein